MSRADTRKIPPPLPPMPPPPAKGLWVWVPEFGWTICEEGRAPVDEPIESDGLPMETDGHCLQANLLPDIVRCNLGERQDFCVASDLGVYFEIGSRPPKHRSPDFMFFWGVDRRRLRRYWLVYEENGRFPDLIIELLSPSTAYADWTEKFDLYRDVWKTKEYFLCDPDNKSLDGYRLDDHGDYVDIPEDAAGRRFSEVLGWSLGLVPDDTPGGPGFWLRFFDGDRLLPTSAEAERQRAETQRRRAERAAQRATNAEQRVNASEQCASDAEQRAEAERLRAEAERLRAERAIQEAETLRRRLEELTCPRPDDSGK